MKSLKLYQEQSITQLITASKMYFDTDGSETIVFQSPTGSGKTFMLSHYISKIIEESELELCFLWVSIGSGNLHEQSYKSVKKTISPKIECSLLERDYFGSKKTISRNEVLFLNWEKIRSKDSKTGEWTNKAMSDKDSVNFIEVLENTRAVERKIILIIDESHSSSNTARAKELRDDVINPFLTIEMSATPVLTSDMQMKITVDPTKVIEEGMIKKEVIINKDIARIEDDEIYSENLILESAYRKRNELAKIFQENKININPLVLIQLPNSDAGELKKKSVIEFLENKNIKEVDGKIAIWLSEEKVNNESDILTPNNSEIEFLLFKQAIDTGWDCPRAHILVKFRETSSITFEIQTVGRILRMPEAKHYISDELNTAYVYTNIKSIEIKKEIYNPNIIKSLCSKRKDLYNPIALNSYYRNRVDFGDLTREYSIFFERSFCKYFGIKYEDNNIPDYESNFNKLSEKGVTITDEEKDVILSNLKIKSENIDKGFKLPEGEMLNVKLSPRDLDVKYDTLINKNLNGFAPVRSISKVKSAILFIFKKYFYFSFENEGIVKIQNIVVKNENIFSYIISESTNAFKDFHKKSVETKSSERFNDQWEVPVTKNYNPETNRVVESIKSLYEPLYMPINKNNKMDELELEFIKYLDIQAEKIEWFWKNGDEHMEANFGIRKEDGYIFQPDFIVKFTNGSIGIFDTKAVGYNENDHEPKSNTLYKYISEERYKGKNLVGGLVIKDENNRFKYYSSALYKPYREAPDSWNDFSELLN